MSAKRRLSRSSKRSRQEAPSASKGKPQLRRQTSSERFKKPGSDQLWESLLGWDQERISRIWLVQAVHDVATSTPSDVHRALVSALGPRVAAAAKKLDAELAQHLVEVWSEDPDSYDPEAPAPKWHLLGNVVSKLGLGQVAAEALQEDWEHWTNLGLAGKPRALLMELLQHTEKAALGLDELTDSDNVKAVANVSRALWFASAALQARPLRSIRCPLLRLQTHRSVVIHLRL
jgi:hypothetical protein